MSLKTTMWDAPQPGRGGPALSCPSCLPVSRQPWLAPPPKCKTTTNTIRPATPLTTRVHSFFRTCLAAQTHSAGPDLRLDRWPHRLTQPATPPTHMAAHRVTGDNAPHAAYDPCDVPTSTAGYCRRSTPGTQATPPLSLPTPSSTSHTPLLAKLLAPRRTQLWLAAGLLGLLHACRLPRRQFGLKHSCAAIKSFGRTTRARAFPRLDSASPVPLVRFPLRTTSRGAVVQSGQRCRADMQLCWTAV